MLLSTFIAALLGAVVGTVATLLLITNSTHDQSAAAVAKLGADMGAVQAEVDRLKKIVPDQSHAMQDVDYHFTNLWFAAKAGNWPLADFYWKETISHLRWAMRIIPVRKDGAGHDVNVQAILEGFENSPLMEVGDSIKAQDPDKFEIKYKGFLEACYTCHKSAEKPYLRPQVPELRTTGIINFDSRATWPK